MSATFVDRNLRQDRAADRNGPGSVCGLIEQYQARLSSWHGRPRMHSNHDYIMPDNSSNPHSGYLLWGISIQIHQEFNSITLVICCEESLYKYTTSSSHSPLKKWLPWQFQTTLYTQKRFARSIPKHTSLYSKCSITHLHRQLPSGCSWCS